MSAGLLARLFGVAAVIKILASADGNAGPLPHGRRLGLWWDIPGRDSVRDLDMYLARMRECGINDLSITVQDHGPRAWHLTWDMENLARFIRACRSHGIRCGVMLWPEPSVEWNRAFAREGAVLVKAGAQFIEFDVEGNWAGHRLRGYRTLEEAAIQLVRIGRGFGRELQATTFPYGAMTAADVIQRVDAFAVQAYSQSDADEEGRESYGWGERLGPGGMQDVGYRKSLEAGADRVIMGLAAYDQNFPGHSPIEAMRRAFDGGLRHTNEFRWWSAKWAFGYPGRTPNSYVIPFLESI